MSLILKILLWCGKLFPWIATGIAWFNKAFNFITTKLITAYFGSRLAITITLLAFSAGVIYLAGEAGSVFGTFVGTLVMSKVNALDNELIKFLFDYIDAVKVFEGLFFFTTTWATYFGCVKTLWIFQKSLLLLRTIHQSIK